MEPAILVEKPVVFSGIWVPRYSIDDHFLRKVSKEFEGKPGAQAIWRLTKEGVTMIVTQSQSGQQRQTDVIAVQTIKEVTVNRYNPLCLMTIYVDHQRRFNVLVCACRGREDAAHIVQVFHQLQRSLSGEGFQLDLKQPKGINWTLKTKHGAGEGGGGGEGSSGGGGGGSVNNGHVDGILVNNNNNNTIHNSYNNQDGEVVVVVVVEEDEEALEREIMQVGGRACYNVGVQAELGGEWAGGGGGGGGDDESDRESTASDLSYQSLKDELLVLSNEVRDIKLLLRQTTGISAEEHFRRQRQGDDPGSPWTLQPVPIKRTRSSDSEGGGGEKRVNFAITPGEASAAAAASGAGQDGTDGGVEDEDFDIRSIGMQTTSGGGGGGGGADGSRGGNRKYTKRLHFLQHGAATLPSRYQPSGWRNRSVSSSSASSSQPSPSPHTPSPFSPHSGSVFTYHHRQQHQQHPGHHREIRSPTNRSPGVSSVFSSSGTVVRPIESVYHVQKVRPGSAGPRSMRRKQHVMVVVPRDPNQIPQRSASLPRQQKAWSTEASAPSSRMGSVAERYGSANSKHARPQLPQSPVQRSAMAAHHAQRTAGGEVHNGASPHSEAAAPAAQNGGGPVSPIEAVVQNEGAQIEAQNGGS